MVALAFSLIPFLERMHTHFAFMDYSRRAIGALPYVTGDTEETYIVFNMGHPCLDKTLKGTTTKCLALQATTKKGPYFCKTKQNNGKELFLEIYILLSLSFIITKKPDI